MSPKHPFYRREMPVDTARFWTHCPSCLCARRPKDASALQRKTYLVIDDSHVKVAELLEGVCEKLACASAM